MLHLSRLILTAVAGFCVLAAPAAAQKVDSKYREFPALGFKFKPMKDWNDVPVESRQQARGIAAQMQAERGPYVKVGNDRLRYDPTLYVIKVEPKQSVTETSGGGEEGGGLRGRVDREEAKEPTAKDYVYDFFGSSLRKSEFDEVVPEVEEVKIEKDYFAHREMIPTFMVASSTLDIVYDVWMFQMSDFKLIFIWTYPQEEDIRKDYSKAVEKSMKSFSFEEVVEAEVTWIDENSTYEQVLKFHENEVLQTPGWELIETPSKKFLIKTNSDKDRRVKDVIKRLEASRALFEEDFPPDKPLTHVSVVRLCGTAEEFHKYGGTGGGVAGWFSPASTELVLFFDPDMGYDMTMSVMTHEGFHQYCHFLFHESEAHRWFDEGHGDYYGAFLMKGSSLKPNEDMKGGLARIPEIQEMLKNGTAKPVSEHIRYDHGQWQGQGPSNVSCYAQSFSIIYMLRQGMRGKVPSKYWNDAWETILPNYIKYLSEGYVEAYAEVRKEIDKELEDAKKLGAPREIIAALESRRNNVRVDERTKQEIWNKAMGESWGKIDEAEFEEAWKAYVLDVL